MALTPRDQSKWDSLQDQSGSAIDNILAGKGSEKDIKELSRVLNAQHELAGQIFDQGVTDAETTAATIVDAMNKKRIDEGKKPLTQKAFDRVFNSTLQQVMSQAIEDILGQIHDEFENQEQTIKDKIDRALDKIRNFAGTPERPAHAGSAPSTQPEARSLFDRFTQSMGGRAQEPASSSGRSLLDRLLNRQARTERQRTSVLQMIREVVSSTKDKVTNLYERFRSRKDDSEDKKASIWMRKLKMIFDPLRNAYGKAKKATSKVGDILSMISKPLMLALMSPQLIKSITDAVSKYLNFDTISKFISDTWESTKKLGSDSIDWIVDKVKSFFGFGKKKEVAAAPVKPKTDPLKQNTQTGVLPKAITSTQAAAALPDYQNKLANAKQQLTAAQTAYARNPSAANKKAVEDAQRTVNLFQTRVTQYQARASESKTAGSSIDQASSFVKSIGSAAPLTGPAGGSDVPKTTTTATAADPTVIMSKSSAAAPAATQIIADTPKFEVGKAFVPPQLKEEAVVEKDKTSAATAQIGLGSFGFDSNDSALNILNLGMIA